MSRKKKLVLSVAAIATMGIIGVTSAGTGADFSASDTGSVSAQSGTLTVELSDSDNTGTFELSYPNLVPGETKVDQFTVKNTGSVAADVKIGQPFSGLQLNLGQANANKLMVAIDGYRTQTPVTSLGNSIDLGSLGAGQSRTYTVRVGLDSSAGNEWQGKTIAANVTVTLQQ